ncbi:MAG: paraquat-inducible protein A [Myxococcota bacterium]
MRPLPGNPHAAAVASQDALLAGAVAALIMWFTANLTPFLTLQYKGGSTTAFLATGSQVLWSDDFFLLSVLVVLTSIIAPLLHISLIGGVLVVLRVGFRGPYVAAMIRLTALLRRWAMPGIYMIGVLVASVKIGQMANLQVGPGFYALIAMVLVWTSITASLDSDTLFAFLEEQT